MRPHHTPHTNHAQKPRAVLFLRTCLEDDRRDLEDLERALAGDVRTRQHTNRREHRQAAVVELLELIILPGLSRLPLRRAEEVSWLVVCPPGVQDANYLNESDENEDLDDAQLGCLPQQRATR